VGRRSGNGPAHIGPDSGAETESPSFGKAQRRKNPKARQGNLGRNAIRGFGATQLDIGMHRDFSITESLKLQFRAEMFNLLNHPNFGPPTAAIGFGGFGLSSQMLNESLSGARGAGAGGFNPLYQVGGPRSVQLALKFSF